MVVPVTNKALHHTNAYLKRDLLNFFLVTDTGACLEKCKRRRTSVWHVSHPESTQVSPSVVGGEKDGVPLVRREWRPTEEAPATTTESGLFPDDEPEHRATLTVKSKLAVVYFLVWC